MILMRWQFVDFDVAGTSYLIVKESLICGDYTRKIIFWYIKKCDLVSGRR